MSTGLPSADARFDFERERRRRALAKLSARLRFEPDDVSLMLPFEEVVAALGRTGERDEGLKVIPLEAVVGTVDRRSGDFDRSFRPASDQLRGRWERVAIARRRGQSLPPIDVYRVGELYFVRDGHHRVSVARALGDETIEAHVIAVATAIGADSEIRMGDLPLKHHERLFHERVPLPPQMRARIKLTDEWRYAQLALLVEARGFRASQARGELLSREQNAELWFREEYEPVVDFLTAAGVGGPGTETDGYLRIAMLRYVLLRTHEWTDEIVERLLAELRRPRRDDDTLVHQLLKEMR